jgi:hypothetical protein
MNAYMNLCKELRNAMARNGKPFQVVGTANVNETQYRRVSVEFGRENGPR